MDGTPTTPAPEDVHILIGNLAEELTRKGYLFATAESCTGGMIAALCTDMAGSSAWFAGGVIAYANHVKIRILNVPAATLEQEGAVSEAVVRHMAHGALSLCNAQAAIAVSGVAGPSGGTPQKPVGTVCIAWAHIAEHNAVHVIAQQFRFPGNRSAVRLAAARESLAGMLHMLQKTAARSPHPSGANAKAPSGGNVIRK